MSGDLRETRYAITCKAGRSICVAIGESAKDRFSGTLVELSPDFKNLFIEFEKIVNTQQFSVLDEISKKIENLRPAARDSAGNVFEIADLQVFPLDKGVSFARRETVDKAYDSIRHCLKRLREWKGAYGRVIRMTDWGPFMYILLQKKLSHKNDLTHGNLVIGLFPIAFNGPMEWENSDFQFE